MKLNPSHENTVNEIRDIMRDVCTYLENTAHYETIAAYFHDKMEYIHKTREWVDPYPTVELHLQKALLNGAYCTNITTKYSPDTESANGRPSDFESKNLGSSPSSVIPIRIGNHGRSIFKINDQYWFRNTQAKQMGVVVDKKAVAICKREMGI